MKVVIAIDSFKGCLTSAEANQAAAEGVLDSNPQADVRQVEVSDGGEGYLQAFHAAVGGEWVELWVRDPLLRPVKARYLLNGKQAVIEMAEASGLTLLTPEERNPLVATTYGTGQLIADAVRRGARHIIVGLGGSATSDAGMGMLHALIDTFAPGAHWDDIRELDKIHFTIASDVQNPLFGPQGAAHVYGPQKGATPAMVERLDARARKFAQVSALHFNYDCSEAPGAGAAGGVGYALMQYLKADCQSGIEILLGAVDFDQQTADADLVITGEGAADRQTLMGKLPVGILRHAGKAAVCLIAGRISHKAELLQAGFSHVECINPPDFPLEEAIRPEIARQHIRQTICRILQEHS